MTSHETNNKKQTAATPATSTTAGATASAATYYHYKLYHYDLFTCLFIYIFIYVFIVSSSAVEAKKRGHVFVELKRLLGVVQLEFRL